MSKSDKKTGDSLPEDPALRNSTQKVSVGGQVVLCLKLLGILGLLGGLLWFFEQVRVQ